MKHSSSAPNFSPTRSTAREHAEDVAHAVSDALAASAALQRATSQLHLAQTGGTAALGAWLHGALHGQLPVGEATGPSLAEATHQLGLHLSALEAEAAELTSRSKQLAAAQSEATVLAHRWVRALLPDACLESVVDAGLQDARTIAPREVGEAALRELCKRHPQAFVRSDLEAACRKTFSGMDEPLRLPALLPVEQQPSQVEETDGFASRPGNVKWGNSRSMRRTRCAVSLTGRRCVSEGPGASAGSSGGSGGGGATPEHGGSGGSCVQERTIKIKPGKKASFERSPQQTKSWTYGTKQLAIDTHRNSGDSDAHKELRDTNAMLAATRAELCATRSELVFLKTFHSGGGTGDVADHEPAVQGAKISPPPHRLEEEVRQLKEQLKESEADRCKMREQLAEAQIELLTSRSPQEEERESGESPLLVKKIARPGGGLRTETRLRERLAESDAELTRLRQELARCQEQLSDSQKALVKCMRDLDASKARMREREGHGRRESRKESIRHTDGDILIRRKHPDPPEMAIMVQAYQTPAPAELDFPEPPVLVRSTTDARAADKPFDLGASLPTRLSLSAALLQQQQQPPAFGDQEPVNSARRTSKTVPVKTPARGPPLAPTKKRSSMLALPDAKASKAKLQERVRALWAKAAEYGYRLVRVGKGFHVTHVHHRPTAVGITDICKHFGSLFAGHEVSIWEFVSQHVRSEEFNSQVSELIGCDASACLRQGHDDRSTTPVDFSSMERAMKFAYDSAFEAVGGQAAAEPFFPAANKVMRELMRKRHHCRARQDVGFEIMGIDMLYATVRTHNEKLVREVKRIAERTGGSTKCPNLKGRPRARAKVLTKYGNDVACLTDVMRASIIYDGIEDLYKALMWICEEDLRVARRDFFILEVNDRFQKCKDGYRDISMLVDVDGVIGEVQMHVETILNAKSSEGHNVYKQQRLINESVFEACVRNAQMDVASLVREYQVCARSIRDKNGRNALHYSCQTGAMQTTRLLLRYRADPWVVDDHGVLACELALKHGHFDVTELMLTQMRTKAPTSDNAPRRLVGHVVRWWCDHVANEPEELLHDRWFDLGKGLIEIARQYTGMRPLNEWFLEDRVRHGHLQSVRAMLRAGFDVVPGEGQPSALDIAIESGQEEMAKFLISFPALGGAHHSLQCARCRSATVHAHLRKAAELEDTKRATAALTAKADPNHTTAKAHGNRTALMAFSAAGNFDMVQRLVTSGAQVGWYDKFGCGAVHYARIFGYNEIEAYLENIKTMPYLGNIPNAKLHATYLPDAIKEGCCAAVWRYVTALGDIDKVGQLEETGKVLSQPLGPYKETMLHLAVQAAIDGKDPAGQVCRALLRYRSDPRAATSKRDLPLHKAAGAGLHNIYDILFQAHTAAEGGELAARTLERSATNEFGQAPKEMLENSIIHQGLRREQAESHDADMLLRVGFIAFQHARMVSRLRTWRDEHAVHLFEVLHRRWSFFAGSTSLEHFESESSSSAESAADATADGSLSPERTSTSRSRNRKRLGAMSKSPGKNEGGSGHWSNAALKKVHIAVKMRNFRRPSVGVASVASALSAASETTKPGVTEDVTGVP